MAHSLHRLTFAVTIRDADNWPDLYREAANMDPDNAPDDGYPDWVVRHLEGVMREAGEKWIKRHPDLFIAGLA